MYVWQKGSLPEGKVKGESVPSTVMSHVALRPGQEISFSCLKDEVKLANKRLCDSKAFYDCSVMIMPPREDPDQRTILVSVTDGFRYRFGGGNAYGMFGMDNIRGTKQSFRVYAGANRAGGTFEDSSIAGSIFLWGASLYYLNSLTTAAPELYHAGLAGLYAGLKPHPDVRITLGVDVLYVFIPDDDSVPGYMDGFGTWLTLSPEITLKRDMVFSGSHMESSLVLKPEGLISPDQEQKFFIPSGQFTWGWFFAQLHSINVKVSGGWSTGDLPFVSSFNCYDNEDQSVRSGYSYNRLTGDSFFLVSLEYRLTFPRFFIPPFLNTGIQLFVFTDLGLVGEFNEALFDTSLLDAYGGGIRVLFHNPVFAYFSFSYGVNRSGKGRFVFAATAGF